MTDITPSKYIIGIILFSIVITGGLSLISIFAEKNSSFIDSEQNSKFNNTFAVYDDITTQVSTIEDNIKNTDEDWGAFGVLNSLIKGSWNTLILLFSSLSFMTTVFQGLYTFFHIPIWVGNAIVSIMTTIISFAIFSAVFQRKL